MSTGQSYLGKGGITTSIEQSAHPNPQTAQNAAKTPQLPDDWAMRPLIVEVTSAVYRAQSQLLEAVDSYMERMSPIEAINEMLERWLTATPEDLQKEYYQHHLAASLQLVTFLVELRVLHEEWVSVTDYESKKEVQNG